MKVVFLHGLEGGPHGHKPTRLRAANHEVIAPELPTKATRELLMKRRAPLPADIAAEPIRVAAEAVASAAPHVVVGSSFGGALAASLTWGGPLVLMAPAAEKLVGVLSLPKRAGRVVIIHGRRDEVIPFEDSVRLAAASACDVALWLVDDDHRLHASVDAGLMDEALAWVTAR
ncbi:MAG: hypothetical protein JNK82_03675 [Myxococcaceae bacterium]|nr:hypothetical protein [Myxococcaceae bacterium]